jgi:hypothetical protein
MKLSQLLQTTDIPVTIDSNLRDQVFQKDLKIKLEKYSYVDAGFNDDLLLKIKEQVKINKKDEGSVKPHVVIIESFERINPSLQIEFVQTLTEMAKKENIKTVLSFTSQAAIPPALKARTINYTQEMAQVYNPENLIKNIRDKGLTNTGIKSTI